VLLCLAYFNNSWHNNNHQYLASNLIPPVPIVAQHAPVNPNLPTQLDPFDLFPGQSCNTPLDFAMESNLKLFNRGFEPIEEKFDLDSSELHHLLCRVKIAI
jgi:hypothetical protein